MKKRLFSAALCVVLIAILAVVNVQAATNADGRLLADES